MYYQILRPDWLIHKKEVVEESNSSILKVNYNYQVNETMLLIDINDDAVISIYTYRCPSLFSFSLSLSRY